MGCAYGSRKKLADISTIEIDLYDGLNTAAVVVLIAFGAPRYHTIYLDGLCGSEPPPVEDILPEDILTPPILIQKLINNRTVQAWYANCECKPKPEPPPPPPPYEPPSNVVCPNPLSYPDEFSMGWSVDIIYEDSLFGESFCRRELFEAGSSYGRSANFTVQIMQNPERAVILRNGEFQTSYPQGANTPIVHYAVAWYKPFGDSRDTDGDDTTEPDYPDFPAICDCVCEPTDLSSITSVLGEILLIVQTLLNSGGLTYTDFRLGLAEINLHSSQSNNRIRDEINDRIDEKKEELRQQIAAFYQFYESKSDQDYTRLTGSLNDLHAATESNADTRRNQVIQWIFDTGNEVKLGITASTAAILAAIVAATATTTAAITAATAAITAAIGTSTATTATNITTAIEGLKAWLTPRFEKIKTDNDKNFKDYNPKRLYVTVDITGKPDNLSQTAGANGAPPIYYYGWIIFISKETDSLDYYYPRIYINTMLSVIRCPAYGENNDCVVHLSSGVTATTTKLFKVEKDG